MTDKILNLIKYNRENEYCDFKREHHKNKADLLLDIICMANSTHQEDCYIIYRVEDKTDEIFDVTSNSKRRTQADIIDFLKKITFAGNYRPQIELKTIVQNEKAIDVLIIKNSLHTPFYIMQDYKDQGITARAGVIYTRSGDRNTSKDGAADLPDIEYLFKKRFGLLLSPIERLNILLQNKSQWDNDGEIHYHKQFPEFTLKFESTEDDDRKKTMFYSYVMDNEQTVWGTVYCKYYDTILCSFSTVLLDSGRT